MPLRLAGESLVPIQGADGRGWVREIAASDGLPGLKVNQQGAGRVFDFQDGGLSKLYLADGGSVTIAGGLVFDLANDVTLSPANPSAPRTLTIPDPGGNDSFAFLAAAQTLVSKTLSSPVIQGVVGAGSGLTMPAFNMTGNLAFQQASTISTASGNLTVSPAGLLDISRSSDNVTFLRTLGNGGSGRHALASDANANALIYSMNSVDLRLGVGATPVQVVLKNGGNIGLGTVDQFGSGTGVIGIANASAVPSANPMGGGVLYAEGGALKFRGSAGTVTTIANA